MKKLFFSVSALRGIAVLIRRTSVRKKLILTITGLFVMAMPQVDATTYYVDAGRPDDGGAATNWATAKQTIQAAVDLTADGDAIWITNGTYRPLSSITVANTITVQSVNGPRATIVDCDGNYSGFKVTAGHCRISGLTITESQSGGIWFVEDSGVASNCWFRGNESSYGGGMSGGTAYNCVFIDNSSWFGVGGGMGGGTAYHCVFIGNGGGMSGGTVYNSVFWGNYPDDLVDSEAYYSCSTDLTHGVNGNITNNPMLASASHISTNSPCRGAGSFAYSSGTDIDGEAWLNPPSMGCDEYHGLGTVTGTPELSLQGPAKLLSGFEADYFFDVQGAVTRTEIDLADGTVLTNQIFLSHAWSATGTYSVVLTAFNDDYPSGLSVTQPVQVVSAEASAVYVSDASGNDASDGQSWATAKKTIQAGVDAQNTFGGTVWVSNGTYSLSAKILVERPVSIVSVNGPGTTIVDGGGSSRCFRLAGENCLISGFTVANGEASYFGGGIYCENDTAVVSNCVVRRNVGGGMRGGTAYNCAFSGNFGRGMSYGTAHNCTFSGNDGAGISGGAAYNSVFWENAPNISGGAEVYYSCSSDLAHGVDGNITNNPLLVSASHIATNSPCRGAGSFTHAFGVDFDGETWLNPPSMGCDEYHGTVTGSLGLSLIGPTNLLVGFSGDYLFDIQGAPTKVTVDFPDDGQVLTNTVYMTHTWNVPGSHDVVLTAFNDDYPGGVSVTQEVFIFSGEGPAVYVSESFGDDVNDGHSWATAKKTIQAGVDAQAVIAGTVWVSNGTYSISSEILVRQPMRIRSVGGPSITVVDGGGETLCFNLSGTRCLLSGFTITNGYAGSSPGGGGIVCADETAVVSNCVMTGNSSSTSGGGMYRGTVYNSTFINNFSGWRGGGLSDGMAYNCTFIGNSSGGGGGMYGGTSYNSIFSGNSASSGGGISYGTAYNCIFSDNSASSDGGGMYYGTAYNCILWGNTAGGLGNDLRYTDAYNSCSPDLTHGVDGNITDNPALLSISHIATNSPCRGAGNFTHATGIDVDGEAWLNPPSMGCDEYHGPGTVTGSLELSLTGPTNLCAGFPGDYFFNVRGAITRTEIDFDDGQVLTTGIYFEKAWDVPDTYNVVLTAFNDEHPSGVSITQAVHIFSTETSAIYVSDSTGDDSDDGQSWATAKKSIQAGVDAQNAFGGRVWVSNGVYILSSEVFAERAVNISSVAGPEVTTVNGGGSVRCFNLEARRCQINGFTVTNGVAYSDKGGGGIYCSDDSSIVSNCMITGNSAGSGGGMYGGTAYNCTLSGNDGGGMRGGVAYNCTFSGNVASWGGGMRHGEAYNCTFSGNDGGGMYDGEAYNCTFSGNDGGGMRNGTVYNSVLWHNTSGGVDENLSYSEAYFTCSPDVTHGVDGNITNAPLLVSASHLATDSPCRGAGAVIHATGTDVDGEAWRNPPSMGCDEYHGSGTVNGTLKLSLTGPTNISAGFSENYFLDIQGTPTKTTIDFADGLVVTNRIYLKHTWSVPDTYGVILTAFNDDYPGGVSVTQTIHVLSDEASAVYVSDLSGDDAKDGLSWSSAKKTIQAGVDAQNVFGGIVWVSNGTYAISSEILVQHPVRIFSAEGPDVTTVDGGGNTRCFNVMARQSRVSGFTITNGDTSDYSAGGGIYCLDETIAISNCVFVGNSTRGGGGAMCNGIAWNCTFSNNTSQNGGGLQSGVAHNSAFIGNFADNNGGGIVYGSAYNCTFSGNSAGRGGGMGDGDAYNCSFSNNTAESNGGGMSYGEAYSCTFNGNSAGNNGGGMDGYNGKAYNCMFSANSAGDDGGGMCNGKAYNCTFSANSADSDGGGMYDGDAYNCILWENTATNSGNNLENTTVFYSCSPDVTHNLDGNITNTPLFIDEIGGNLQLQSPSPCINAGDNVYVSTGLDLIGNPRIDEGTIDMGAFEFKLDDLYITPPKKLMSIGYEGGPFNPPNQVYTLTNTGDSNLMWTASWNHSWLAVSPTGSTLLAGGSTNVTVSLTVAAKLLSLGTYSDTVVFSNLVSGAVRSREIVLDVSLPIISSESFESGMGDWVDSSGYDFNWTRRGGSTPSSGTGPSGAADGTYYIYTEASDPNYPDKIAAIEATFDFSGISEPILSFDYHMYGSAMGSLYVDVFDGTWHTNEWSLIGQQQSGNDDAWKQASVDLSSYGNISNLNIRFRGVTGSGYTSDMAVDNIILHDAHNPGISIAGPLLVNASSTNLYTCGVQYPDGSTSNVTDAAIWNLLGDAYGTTLVSNELTVPAVVLDETITIQAVYGGFTNTVEVGFITPTNLFITGSSVLIDDSTNLYGCALQYADDSIIKATDLATWSLVGDAHGATLTGNELSVGTIASNATITIQAVYGSLTNTHSVLLKVIPPGLTPLGTLFDDPTADAEAVVCSNGYAYVACGYAGLIIFNVSDPANPVRIGGYDTEGRALDIAVRSNLVFIADGYGDLQIVDVSTPSSPTSSGSWKSDYDIAYARKVALSGNYAFLAAGRRGLLVFDLGNISNPRLVAEYETDNAWGVDVTGNYAYVADYTNGLKIIDVSSPDNPVHVSSCLDVLSSRNVVVQDGYAYVADYTNGLQIIDVGDPTNPVHVGGYVTKYSYDVAVDGSYVYLANSGYGVEVVDVSNPSAPVPTDVFDDNKGYAKNLFVLNGTAYVANGNGGLQILDVSIPASPSFLGSYDTHRYSYDVAVKGSYAYLAAYRDGLITVDISNPTNLVVVATNKWTTYPYAYGLDIAADYVYVAQSGRGLAIFNLSTPSSPMLITEYDLGYENIRDVRVVGDYAFCANSYYNEDRDSTNALCVVDISTPSAPVYVGGYSTGGRAYGVDVQGQYAYLASHTNGLQIFDISDPENPLLTGAYIRPPKTEFEPQPSYAIEIAVFGQYAYMLESGTTLEIIDVSDPGSPNLIAVCNLGRVSTLSDLCVEYPYIFIAYDTGFVMPERNGLWVIDVSDPSSPVVVADHLTSGYSRGVTVSGGHVYLADDPKGLHTFTWGAVPTPTKSITNFLIYRFPGFQNVSTLSSKTTNGYEGFVEFSDKSHQNVSTTATWIVIGDAHGAVFDRNRLTADSITSNGAVITIQGSYGGFSGTLGVTLFDDRNNNGIPDWWEIQFFGGATDANPSGTCSNGVNTVWEAYVAGLDPNDPNAAFLTSIQWNPPQAILGWNTASDRVYSVWWTTNLLENFQPLETNLPWTQGSYTNPDAPPCSFYKIKVELEE